jgi:riboflavin synthase
MFTGIVQAIGRVSEKKETDSGLFLKVQTEKSFLDNLKIGASVAVNGVCLTVTEFSKDTISFDVIPETLRVTNLETILMNSELNLERSLKFGDEVGGHVLSGHISCRAPSKIIRSDNEIEMIIKCPGDWINYIFHKGYVAINGASLTVAKKTEQSFSVYLIPETLSATNLSDINDGDLLNIEVDQTTYAAVKAAEARLEGS